MKPKTELEPVVEPEIEFFKLKLKRLRLEIYRTCSK
jgi:hypothetical protein